MGNFWTILKNIHSLNLFTYTFVYRDLVGEILIHSIYHNFTVHTSFSKKGSDKNWIDIIEIKDGSNFMI